MSPVPGGRSRIRWTEPGPPIHLPQKLLRVLRDHGPAQDRRRGVVQEKSHRHQLQAAALHGLNGIRLGIDHGPFIGAKHQADARAVGRNVAQAYRRSCLAQGHGQIRRDGGFSHAAFAARHGDHIFHPFDFRRRDRSARGRLRRRLNIDAHDHLADPGDLAQRLLGLLLDLLRHARVRRRERHLHGDVAPQNANVFHQPEGNNITGETGISHDGQFFANLGLGNLGHKSNGKIGIGRSGVRRNGGCRRRRGSMVGIKHASGFLSGDLEALRAAGASDHRDGAQSVQRAGKARAAMASTQGLLVAPHRPGTPARVPRYGRSAHDHLLSRPLLIGSRERRIS